MYLYLYLYFRLKDFEIELLLSYLISFPHSPLFPLSLSLSIYRFAHMLNNTRGNIGARRLTNVLHTVLEDVSFLAHRMAGSTQTIDAQYVQTRMKIADPSSEENLSKYII